MATKTPAPPSPERHVFEFAKYAMSVGWQDLEPLPLWKAYNAWSRRYGSRYPADAVGKPRLCWEEFSGIFSQIRFTPEPKTVSLTAKGILYRGAVE